MSLLYDSLPESSYVLLSNYTWTMACVFVAIFPWTFGGQINYKFQWKGGFWIIKGERERWSEGTTVIHVFWYLGLASFRSGTMRVTRAMRARKKERRGGRMKRVSWHVVKGASQKFRCCNNFVHHVLMWYCASAKCYVQLSRYYHPLFRQGSSGFFPNHGDKVYDFRSVEWPTRQLRMKHT